MTVWSRLRGIVLGQEPDAPPPPPAAPPPAAREEEREPTALELLVSLGSSGDLEADVDTRATALFDRAAEGGDAVAIEAARALMTRRRLPKLRVRLADRLLSRGDDASAAAVLEPLLPPAEGPIEAWMLAAEIAERKNDPARALVLYERVLARDYGQLRARDRALRLREASAAPKKLDGATLLGEGATTRRFRILAELGRGGAGTVFLAEEPSLSREVALKIYHRRGRSDRERMLHEARLACALEHPGVVRVLDVDTSLGAIAMEPLSDGSVKSMLSRGPVPRDRALGWARSLLDALTFVHARGLVHCDLKPSNFLLRGETVVLTDFGIARALGVAPREMGEGSLGYMAPEQRTQAEASLAMDVHALGASLREMLPEAVDLAPLLSACTSASPEARPTLETVRRALG